jgi:hypothetical protein
MKNWIKTSIAAVVIATGAMGSSATLAWGGGCGYDGPGGKAGWHRMAPEQMKERMTQRSEQHLARLELALALTAEQKPAWESFKGTMKQGTDTTIAEMERRHDAKAPKTAIERLQLMEEMSKLRQARLMEAREAVEAFYPQLSDAQKAVFDAEFRHHMRMEGRGMGRGDGPRGGMGPRG